MNKNIKIKNILIVIGTFYSIIITIICVFFISKSVKISDENNNYSIVFRDKECNQDTDASNKDETNNSKECDLLIENADLLKSVKDKTYELNFNDRVVLIPEDWVVSNVKVQNRDFTEEEKNEFIKPLKLGDDVYYGNYSLNELYELEITNGESVISIFARNGYMRGPWGIVPSNVSDLFVIVREPKDNVMGIARVVSHDNNLEHQYYGINKADPVEFPPMGYYYVDSPGDLIFSFIGNDKDLPTADKIFETFILGDI